MNKYILGAVFSLGLLVSPIFASPVQAAGLTSSQVNAILSLLSSFGADQSIINNVCASLGGSSCGGSTLAYLSVTQGPNDPVSSNILAGSSQLMVGQFKFMAHNSSYTVNNLTVFIPNNAASVANVQIQYSDANGNKQNSIQSLTYDGSGTSGGSAHFTGLTMYVPANSPANLNVYVDIPTIASGAASGAAIRVGLDGGTTAAMGDFRAIDNSNGMALGQINSGMTTYSGGTFYVRKSIPTFATIRTGVAIPATPSVGVPLYKFSITANPAGDIEWSKVTFNIVATGMSVSNVYLTDDASGSRLTDSNVSPSGNLAVINLGTNTTGVKYSQIAAGVTRTYNLYGTVSGLTTGSSLYATIISDSPNNYPPTSAVLNAPMTFVSGNTIWSDLSSYNHSINSSDWTNGYLLKDFSGSSYSAGGACSSLYWTDTTNKSCQSQKQFCGSYMYQGLQTFSTQQACLNSVTSAPPTVVLGANPLTITAGQSSTLTLSTTNADSCSITGRESNTTNSVWGVYPQQTTTYTTICTGPGGSTTKSVTVTVNQTPPALTATITSSVTVPAQTYFTLSGVTSLPVGSYIYLEYGNGGGSGRDVVKADGSWTFAYQASGGLSAGSYPITLRAYSAVGTIIGSGTLTVTVNQATPTVTLTANPITITSGQSTTLTWSSTNATSCVESGGWSGGYPMVGQSPPFRPTQTTTYTITCTGPGGSTTQSVTVTVSQATPISNNKPTGVIDTVSSGAVGTCGNVAGWAYDADNVAASTEINVYLDGPAGSGTGFNAGATTGSRPDVNTYFGITGIHGYNYQIPNLTPGNHTVYSYSHGVDTAGTMVSEPVLLVNSPMSFVCNPAPLSLIGGSNQMASALGALNSATPAQVAQVATNPGFRYSWNRNLEIGSSYTEDVKALQTALTHEGVYTGEISGGFYNQTFSGVKAFQEKYGIDTGITGAGFVGAKTRAKLNTLY